MAGMRRMLRVCHHSLIKHMGSYRVVFIAALSLGYLYYTGGRMRALCDALQIGAAPLPLFIINFTKPQTACGLMLCWLLLICDAPFADSSQPFVLARCGRYAWSAGQQIYLLAASALYWLWIALASVIVMLGRVEWSWEWGQFFYSCWQTGNTLFYMGNLLIDFSAPVAFGLYFLLSWLVAVFFAQLVYCINLVTGRATGILLPMAAVLFHITQYGEGPMRFLWFSPMALADLVHLEVNGRAKLPSLQYALAFFAIGIAALFATNVLCMRRKPISVRKPV